MTNEDLKRLEKLSSHAELKKGLDALMNSCFDRIGWMVTIAGEMESESKELVAAVNSLWERYKEGAEGMHEHTELALASKTYISLDTGLFPSLSKEAQKALGRKFRFEPQPGKAPELFDGRGLRLIYEEERMQIIDLLERNSGLLPERTREYVAYKKKERELQPTPTILRNEFEYRTYLRNIPEEFSFEPFYIAFKFFRFKSKKEDKAHSLFYFIRALTEKYGYPNRTEGFESVFDEAAGGLLEILKEKLSSRQEQPEFEDLKRVLRENGKTAKILFEYLERYNLKGVSDFLGEFVQPKQQKQR